MMEERRPNFATFVVWSANYVLAKFLRREGSISSCSFYGQLAGYYSHVFSLIHPMDEFSFQGMRTWGQSKISSCSLCVWCKSREMRGGRSPRFINGRELLLRPSSYRKLLDRVAFRILSNINDGVPLWMYVERLWVIGLMMVMLMVFFTYDELVPILRNGCGIWG